MKTIPTKFYCYRVRTPNGVRWMNRREVDKMLDEVFFNGRELLVDNSGVSLSQEPSNVERVVEKTKTSFAKAEKEGK